MDAKKIEQIVLDIIEAQPTSKAAFDDIRRKSSSRLGMSQPANRELLKAYQTLLENKSIEPQPHLKKLFQKAGIRSNSGIAVITSLLKPYPCPGKCVYCPTEVKMPKSYIASEPAAARSLKLNFNPYLLMQRRIAMLEANGHPTDKIEYITKGGTWNAYTLKYQYWYMLESFKACNNLSRKKEIPYTEESFWKDTPLSELINATLKEQTYNETATHRIIGVTLETRPDAITPKTIHHMRQQGCTRVELGLQAPDDRILTLIQRGHTVEQFKKAMYLLRQAGFKVDLHFMPDLPGTTPAHDVEMYTQLFSDRELRPDMVKIYPNTVIKSAELYEWFQDGRYTPYGEEALFHALLDMKRATPRYCRISRLIRDIPEPEIQAGNKITNLREALQDELAKHDERCVCLRCREIFRQRDKLDPTVEPQIFVDEYETAGGTEYFITFEDPKRIAVYGFLRLRIPEIMSEMDFPMTGEVGMSVEELMRVNKQLYDLMPELQYAAFVRELHVYGQLVKIGKKNELAAQHKGYGKRLMQKAEEIVQEHGMKKLAVISGVGVRGYYAKLGYRKQGTYMVKSL
jgi:elongator complex protein 3